MSQRVFPRKITASISWLKIVQSKIQIDPLGWPFLSE